MDKVDKKVMIAVGAGVGAALFATLLFVIVDSFKAPEKPREKVVEVRVLKALKEIPEGTLATPEMLGYTTVPMLKVGEGTIVDPVQVANLKALHTVASGSVLQKSDFQSFTPATIPEGFVAMSLQVDTVSGVTWMVKPDDIVDIIGVLRPVSGTDKRGQISSVLLQAVRILAVDAPRPKKGKQVDVRENGTVTFLMKPDQAQKLMLLSEAGKYTMALRGAGDETERKVPPVSVAQLTAGSSVPALPNKKTIRPQNGNRLVVVEVK